MLLEARGRRRSGFREQTCVAPGGGGAAGFQGIQSHGMGEFALHEIRPLGLGEGGLHGVQLRGTAEGCKSGWALGQKNAPEGTRQLSQHQHHITPLCSQG